MPPSKQHVRRRLHKSCHNRDVRSLILRALDEGARVRFTKGGVMVFGPEGAVSLHFTASEYRGVANAEADLRRAGINI